MVGKRISVVCFAFIVRVEINLPVERNVGNFAVTPGLGFAAVRTPITAFQNGVGVQSELMTLAAFPKHLVVKISAVLG